MHAVERDRWKDAGGEPPFAWGVERVALFWSAPGGTWPCYAIAPRFVHLRLYQKEASIFCTCYTDVSFAEGKLNFLFCMEICFCVKVHSTLQIVTSKSFDSKLFFVYTLKLLKGTFAHNFCFILKNIYALLQSLLNECETLKWTPRHLWKSEGRGDHFVHLPKYLPLSASASLF